MTNHLPSFLIQPQVLDLVVVVIKQATEVKLIILFGLELDCVGVLCPLPLENHLAFSRVVVHGYRVPYEVTEGCHLVVLTGVNR